MATAETATRSPVEIARHIFEDVLNRRDADALRPYWADDLVEELPTGTARGPDEMAQYFAETFAALPDFHITPEKIAGEDDTVFVKWRLNATFTGSQWQGIEATGDRIELRGIDCFTFRGGQIVRSERGMRSAFNALTKLKRRLGRAKS
jgi:steroid delta-isomerase-like uncharacterized protein